MSGTGAIAEIRRLRAGLLEIAAVDVDGLPEGLRGLFLTIEGGGAGAEHPSLAAEYTWLAQHLQRVAALSPHDLPEGDAWVVDRARAVLDGQSP
jgi:hypothetical protein